MTLIVMKGEILKLELINKLFVPSRNGVFYFVLCFSFCYLVASLIFVRYFLALVCSRGKRYNIGVLLLKNVCEKQN